MGGGLLNILSYGASNILVYGNPQKSVFRSTYKSITNFGIQRIRLDQVGNTTLSVTEETKFTFKLARHAEMVGDCHLVVTLPDIWSPLVNIAEPPFNIKDDELNVEWMETGFKWIEELGTNMINEVEITSGGQSFGKYTGEYFSLITHRDYPDKVELWNQMTGNVPELNDPANAYGRDNCYPNVKVDSTSPNDDLEPSIRGRKLYIPLNMWFTRGPGVALPLVASQYDEITIVLKLKPIKDLFIVRDIRDVSNSYPYVAPNMALPEHQPYRYFQQPQTIKWDNMHPLQVTWKPDIHLLSTYYFLSEKESEKIAKTEQKFLVKDVCRHSIQKLVGSTVNSIDSRGLVSSFLFYLRRSDAHMRNEWSNYTNWPYKDLPYNVDEHSTPDKRFMLTGKRENANEKSILKTFNIRLDGKDRENILDAGVCKYVEPYHRTPGMNKEGSYLYSFGTNTDIKQYQPYGGMNLDKFNLVELLIETIIPPPTKTDIEQHTICDDDGSIIGFRKNVNDIYEYTYDLEVYEERYNVVIIKSGTLSMLFAR
jgi:hypothetical protein